jgi:hypothetical protein
VVFLVPGFLGFERFEDYAYFAERCAVTLRAALSARAGAPELRVIPVPIPPTAALAARQRALAKTLVRRAQAISRSENLEVAGIHLLGHSTGGVDAELLTYEQPQAPLRSWADFDGVDIGWLRRRLRSVVSVASPHQGTCLALDPIARMLVSGDAGRLLGSVPPAFKELLSLLSALPALLSDQELPALITGVLQSTEGRQFLRELWTSRALIGDLTPEACAMRRAAAGDKLSVLRRSFVTVAGASPNYRQAALDVLHEHRLLRPCDGAIPFAPRAPASVPDGLFLLLSTLTSGRSNPAATQAPLLYGSQERLASALQDPARVIAASADLIPLEVDAIINDGVVNSARQLIDPADASELAAVVVADHFDVVGHYDRSSWVTDPQTGDEQLQTVVNGLLHSGSEFRDNEFFELFHAISDCISQAFGS